MGADRMISTDKEDGSYLLFKTGAQVFEDRIEGLFNSLELGVREGVLKNEFMRLLSARASDINRQVF